ncbi:MAG: shikimate dehydrogenase [Rugosibacter sp.]|jgi:shikimate dehydrogenase|nr:shikimate dehydrogenase [Rugosibacter sp.]
MATELDTESSRDRYAVFGHPVAHSLSPRIHAMFAAQTAQAMHYEAICAPLDGFAAAVKAFIAAGGQGANVTVPFKIEAFALAQQLTPRAKAAGAVNTLSFHGAAEGREIAGDNTDGAGLVRDITHNLGVPLAGKRILILGAGGAARGVILPLQNEAPAAIVIANRTAATARALADAFASAGHQCALVGGGFELLAGQAFDVVINATSAGLTDAVLPAPTFSPGALAYEMVYGRQTRFMQAARVAGAAQAGQVRVADGLGMLVEQAAEAFFVWRGVRPETAPVRAALRAALDGAMDSA